MEKRDAFALDTFEGSRTMFQRMLVPLDGSKRAERAIPVAARLAQASGGSIALLRVVTSPVGYEWQTSESPMLLQESQVADQARAADYLAHIAASDELAGIATTTEVFHGMPAQTILSVAHSQQTDIIIMCSHGYTGMAHRVMGSVTEKVARHAPVPVFVLREAGTLPAGPHLDATHPLRALVALDGSARAKSALEPAACFIAALAAPGKGALHLAQVVKPATPGNEEKGIDEGVENESMLHNAQKYLSSIIEHFHVGLVAPAVASHKLLVTCVVAVDDDVASALVRLAENTGNARDAEGAGVFGGCDIIAMATHGIGGIQRWAMGSITERVLNATKIPLLIVRPLDMMDKSNFIWDEITLSDIQA